MAYEFNKEGIVLNNNEIISWDIIKNELAKIELSNKILVTFSFRYGRSTYYDESYILDINEWKELKQRMIGKTIYFGEIAGKHSEVCYDVTENSIIENTNFNDIVKFNTLYGYSNIDADPINTFYDNESDGYYDED